MNKPFPIGYLRCIKCDRPALWLVEGNNEYIPTYDKTVDLNLKYRLININLPEISLDNEDCFICDSCVTHIEEDNIHEKYLIFFDKIDNTYKQ